MARRRREGARVWQLSALIAPFVRKLLGGRLSAPARGRAAGWRGPAQPGAAAEVAPARRAAAPAGRRRARGPRSGAIVRARRRLRPKYTAAPAARAPPRTAAPPHETAARRGLAAGLSTALLSLSRDRRGRCSTPNPAPIAARADRAPPPRGAAHGAAPARPPPAVPSPSAPRAACPACPLLSEKGACAPFEAPAALDPRADARAAAGQRFSSSARGSLQIEFLLRRRASSLHRKVGVEREDALVLAAPRKLGAALPFPPLRLVDDEDLLAAHEVGWEESKTIVAVTQHRCRGRSRGKRRDRWGPCP